MRIAITGASGFIGRYVLAILERQEIPYVVLGRACPENVPCERFHRIDLLGSYSAADLENLKCTHLIHLAWYAEHGLFWSSSANFDWVSASVSLIRVFAGFGAHVTAVGTCAEYDWSFGLCIENKTPIAPASTYGVAKAATSQLAKAACSSVGAGYCWGRVFFPFGYGESAERLIPSLVGAILRRKEPMTVGWGDWRDLLAVEDVAEAIVHVAVGRFCGEVNICSGIPRTIGSLVEEISRVIGRSSTGLVTERSFQSGPRWVVGDDTLLRTSGWAPTQPFEARLAAYVRRLA